jgi:transcriptional regulator with XRE-family HTH domain
MAGNPINREIAERVRSAAKAAGLTHEALALQVGMADRTFSRFMTGNADWKTVDVAAIAEALELDAIDLIPSRAA